MTNVGGLLATELKFENFSVRPEIRFRFRFRSIFSDPVPVRFRPNTDRIDRI